MSLESFVIHSDYVVIRFPWLGTKMTARQILVILVASLVISAILTVAQLLFAENSTARGKR